MVADIAAALAPGLSRLRSLVLEDFDVDSELRGCARSLPLRSRFTHCGSASDVSLFWNIGAPVSPPRSRCYRVTALFAALGANVHLTTLELTDGLCFGGRHEAAIALASSLHNNRTLRKLQINNGSCTSMCGAEGMRLVLAALGGSDERPSCCGLTSLTLGSLALDLPACAALGQSLARGTTLEELCLATQSGRAVPDGPAAIFEGLAATVTGGRSRLRVLTISSYPILREGANP